MEHGTLPVLAGWESFYVIMGTAVAALIGLQFVVIVLSAEMHVRAADAHHVFATPTIVHFCAVLFIATSLSAPWPVLFGVAIVLGLCGVAGLVYMAVIIRAVRQQTDYKPVVEDWIFHFTFPPVAYATLLVSAILLQEHPVVVLFVVSGAVILLLFVGIHNAWDSVTFIALQQPGTDTPDDQT